METLLWRGRALPSPAAYLDAPDVLDALLMLTLDDAYGRAPSEEACQMLGFRYAMGYRDDAFDDCVTRHLGGVLRDRVKAEDTDSVRRILKQEADLTDDALAACTAFAGETGAKEPYLLLVNEMARRGLVGEDGKRL